jgi:cytochrome d ubiquinol oxidase subunit II
LLYPQVSPPTGPTARAAVVSPLALTLVTVAGLSVLLLVFRHFKFRYAGFSGPVTGPYGG